MTSLLLYESIRTTKNRARAIQPMVDRLLRTARRQEPQVAIRSINKVVTDKNACRKIMEVLKVRYANRHSGLTRIVPAGTRQGDGAMVVDLILVDAELGTQTAVKSEKKVKATPTEKAIKAESIVKKTTKKPSAKKTK
ncbi:MAG: bL17 family ribosomal protein [Candidatus Binatia bacterium]|nr:bL17 family ribosomal protein [Candidatus Binatia bacterium]